MCARAGCAALRGGCARRLFEPFSILRRARRSLRRHCRWSHSRARRASRAMRTTRRSRAPPWAATAASRAPRAPLPPRAPPGKNRPASGSQHRSGKWEPRAPPRHGPARQPFRECQREHAQSPVLPLGMLIPVLPLGVLIPAAVSRRPWMVEHPTCQIVLCDPIPLRWLH